MKGPNGVLVMFICNHCPYVKAVIDRIVRDCAELKAHGIGAAAISANDPTDYPEDSFDNMQRVARQLQFPFPYLWDESQAVARAYDAVCTPDFFGFNKDLQLQYRGRLDASRTSPVPDARRELFEAMVADRAHGTGAARPDRPAWGARSSGSAAELLLAATQVLLSAETDVLERVIEVVKRVATEEIMPRFLRVAHQRKADGSLFTEADLAAQEALSRALRDIAPAPVVGEEMTEKSKPSSGCPGEGGLWCVDPIDGTSNFVYGVPYFAVSVALMKQGRSVLGVVYQPITDEAFYAERGAGAFLNGEPLPLRVQTARMRGAVAGVDFKRVPASLSAALAASAPYSSQRNFGAATLDWCYVAAGRFDLYLHGGQKLWDYAAGSLILQEAGGSACHAHARRFLGRRPLAALRHRRTRPGAVRAVARLDSRAPLTEAQTARCRARCIRTVVAGEVRSRTCRRSRRNCLFIRGFLDRHRSSGYLPKFPLPQPGSPPEWRLGERALTRDPNRELRRTTTMEMTAPGVTSQVELTGAEITIRCLQEEGVQFVFGYPGGAILPIYDEMFKQDKVKHILVRHEQAAVHGADGYARATDKVGVVMVTSGPGVTNAVTGIADRLHGLDPAGHHQRAGADACDRAGCLPGSRHGGRHPSLCEAQLPGEGRARHRAHHQEGLLHRQDRPSRPGAGGHPQGRAAGEDPVPLPGQHQHALVQPGGEGSWRADQEGDAAHRCRRSAR